MQIYLALNKWELITLSQISNLSPKLLPILALDIADSFLNPAKVSAAGEFWHHTSCKPRAAPTLNRSPASLGTFELI